MAAVSTNIKIDADLKKEAQELFENLGMNLSTAVNIFLRQAVREQAIPFSVRIPVYNAETRRAIEEARSGVRVSGPFDTVAEVMEALDADDGDETDR